MDNDECKEMVRKILHNNIQTAKAYLVVEIIKQKYIFKIDDIYQTFEFLDINIFLPK